MLPEFLNGNISRNRLITHDKIKKFSILLPFKNLKFLKTKAKNKKAIIDIIKNPTIPISVKICK